MRKLQEEYSPLLEGLLSSLREFFDEALISLVVFGSVARGEAHSDSDIDLLLVVEGLPKSRLKRQSLFAQAERKNQRLMDELWNKNFHVDYSPILLTPDEAKKLRPLYLDMVSDAIILHDKNDFFRQVLNRLRRRLRELGAKRIRLGKLWYWDLKPDYRFGEFIEIE